ncbi:MAG TPA: amino acid adenylation domain-containing protein, partial [Longimicrobiaceae bacterium]|nr:amino acid adenylation domain-containing protein [Longimicrobiaceae bacterium]
EARSNRLARWLRARGVGPEVPVGLCLERSLEMVVAILGVLGAGGAYVPLDPAYPPDRLAFLLEDSGVGIVLTQTALAARVRGGRAEVVALDAERERIAAHDDTPLPEAAAAESLAYVIYTSGSTGRPKGVQVTHASVVRLFTATEPWFGFGERDVWTLFHSYAFDFSVWEIWGALLYGGRLVVVPYLTSRSPDEFLRLLAEEEVTVLSQTPSAFRQLVAAEEPAGAAELALRLVVFGGEALEPGTLRPWVERHGDERPRLVNMYGITETTVHVTYRPVTRRDVESGSTSPIGVPIPDLGVYVLDAGGGPAPVGVPGEMYVAGAGVARGYLGRPERTAQRFVPDAYGGVPGARLYRSGDRARWLSGGELEYLGRLDEQVKIRGFRIELGEVEAALRAHPGVGDCVVVAREDAPGERRLVGYVVGAEGADAPGADALRAHLRERLPEHMVPSALVPLARIPLTSNGKTDRRALPAPDPAAGGDYVAPRDPAEEALAAIFAGVLGAERVGVHDDFFELGGHSLLAVRLLSRIRQETGANVPLHALFEGGTVEKLARIVAGREGERVRSPLVAIRETGSSRPLFCVHAVDGHVLSYALLAAALDADRPLYGLQAAGVDGGDPLESVEEMAAAYVAALRTVQPAGPYALCGWSMGGVVAFEAARRLRAAGEEVGALILLDPPRAVRAPDAGDEADFLEETLRDLLGGSLPESLSAAHFRSLPPGERIASLHAEAVRAGALPPDLDPGRLRDLLRVRRANLRALRSYIPAAYDGRALLLEAGERPAPDGEGLRPLPWQSLCGGELEVRRVPGNHFSMVREPHVRRVAERIEAWLDQTGR